MNPLNLAAFIQNGIFLVLYLIAVFLLIKNISSKDPRIFNKNAFKKISPAIVWIIAAIMSATYRSARLFEYFGICATFLSLCLFLLVGAILDPDTSNKIAFPTAIFFGLLFGLLCSLYTYLIYSVIPHYAPDAFYTPDFIFQLVFLTPLWEEIIYRGYIQNFFTYVTKKRFFGIIFTSILWANAHLSMIDPPWVKFLQIAGVGALIGYVYTKKGLTAGVTAHSLLNLFTIFMGNLSH